MVVNLFTTHCTFNFGFSLSAELCAKASFKPLKYRTSLYKKLVNFVSARALNIQKFVQLLSEMNSYRVVY